ncbi:hypothetical protein J2X11_001667 [Aeromicrobium panaciterrae]|uniref:Uncharacterized protein n=1 Tax=Aeromicrobium panaciterrae TaxID=363861 RepID=A0ABU1UNR8_9ACTN|nr:hypothetical protein [Aeromicrobium panaciterrae]MDR7086828.1 hypothetical protein [Aeromicrobium panaciterrae]
MAEKTHALATALWKYKDRDIDDGERHAAAARLRDLFESYLVNHERCLANATGVEGFDVICPIPSSKGRTGIHPLSELLAYSDWASGRFRADILKTVRAGTPHQPDSGRFSATDVAGLSVLIVDDTWTTSSNVMSAVAAIQGGSPRAVAVAVIGRHFDPTYSAETAEFSERAHARPFVMDDCVHHEIAETVGRASLPRGWAITHSQPELKTKNDPFLRNAGEPVSIEVLWQELAGITLASDLALQLKATEESEDLAAFDPRTLNTGANRAMNKHPTYQLKLSDWLRECRAIVAAVPGGTVSATRSKPIVDGEPELVRYARLAAEKARGAEVRQADLPKYKAREAEVAARFKASGRLEPAGAKEDETDQEEVSDGNALIQQAIDRVDREFRDEDEHTRRQLGHQARNLAIGRGVPDSELDEFVSNFVEQEFSVWLEAQKTDRAKERKAAGPRAVAEELEMKVHLAELRALEAQAREQAELEALQKRMEESKPSPKPAANRPAPTPDATSTDVQKVPSAAQKDSTSTGLGGDPSICPRCAGSGHLPHYNHVAEGVCFLCGGSGRVSVAVRRSHRRWWWPWGTR